MEEDQARQVHQPGLLGEGPVRGLDQLDLLPVGVVVDVLQGLQHLKAGLAAFVLV